MDNFAFKNSNIIIEGLTWQRKNYFPWKQFETQTNNFIKKFYVCPNSFSYRFEPNFKKWCDSNKSRFIFLEKRFSTTWPFPIINNIAILESKIIYFCLRSNFCDQTTLRGPKSKGFLTNFLSKSTACEVTNFCSLRGVF